MGDPCGIGPEVTLKTVADESLSGAARIVVLGDEQHLRRTARELKLKWAFSSVVDEVPQGRRWERPVLIDMRNVDPGLLPGQISALAGKAAAQCIERATELALAGQVEGIVTAPLHKEALSMAGYTDPGHTEMLARLTSSKKTAMLFWSEELSVSPLTTHLSLREAVAKVRRSRVLAQLRVLDREWTRFFGKKPRIGVAALNPHGGEGSRFGVEEQRDLLPALERARNLGLRVYGPTPADAIFGQARSGQYDVVLTMYHDQATIPVKLLCGLKAVNVTLGLPFVRTSVDHGTAMDIAGKGLASEESMVTATRLAAQLARGPA
jgi:4-hydroxythreonine-4-phosphate dehydrogenase